MPSSVCLLLLTVALAGAREDMTGREGEGIRNRDQVIREQLNKEVI